MVYVFGFSWGCGFILVFWDFEVVCLFKFEVFGDDFVISLFLEK